MSSYSKHTVLIVIFVILIVVLDLFGVCLQSQLGAVKLEKKSWSN
jgi:NADH:ubiquinone oxidoreductase subunit 3 (subunit A)